MRAQRVPAHESRAFVPLKKNEHFEPTNHPGRGEGEGLNTMGLEPSRSIWQDQMCPVLATFLYLACNHSGLNSQCTTTAANNLLSYSCGEMCSLGAILVKGTVSPD